MGVQNTITQAHLLLSLSMLRTRHLALEENGDGAVASVISTLGLPRVFTLEPTLVCSMIAASYAGKAAKDAATVLSLTVPSASSLRALKKSFADVALVARFREVLLTERVYGLAMTREVIGESMGVDWSEERLPPGQMWPGTLRPRFFYRALVRGYLRDFRVFLAAVEEPWHAAREGLLNAQTESVLGKNLHSSLVRGADSLAEVAALVRAAQVATLVEQYRATNGHVPQSLDALVPEFTTVLPEDHFVVAPLRFVVQEDGYLIYSDGKNGTDDGGDSENRHDVGLRVRRQP